MIDYNAFHNYLTELVDMFHRNRSTKGMSQLAQKWHCTAITRDQFYQMKLDKLQPQQLTPQLSRVIRDTIGRHDAKATLRDTIGALNEGILSGGRITQGSDRTVQITFTQPVESKPTEKSEPATGKIPLYRPGQVLISNAGTLYLVSRLLDNEHYTWDYYLAPHKANPSQTIAINVDGSSQWTGRDWIRPAKGNDVARFLGALTRSGYEWTADNANGLFFVKDKPKVERKPVEVFSGDLPLSDYDNTGIHALPSISPSPYRYALGPLIPTDNGGDFMTERHETTLLNAVVRQIKSAFPDFYHIREMFEYEMPALCCSEDIKEYRVALVKDDNNGTCYWLAKDRDVLRLLSWIAYII